MPSQVLSSVENNFTKGLVTEFTGLNFPENAATDADNVEFTLVGDVLRREGIDYEANFIASSIDRTGQGVNSYKWNNAGGDGLTQLVVTQVGGFLKFWVSSKATVLSPLSSQILASTVQISTFVAAGTTFDITAECQFSDGNGYLFVYHPSCDPFYVTYVAGTVTANSITVKIRDFAGIFESTAVNVRPTSDSNEHLYNLTNQGWSQGSPWGALSATVNTVALGSEIFTVPASLSVTLGNLVQLLNDHDAFPGGIFQAAGRVVMSGTVTGYTGTSMTINITSINPVWAGSAYSDWLIVPVSTGYINTWHSAIGNFPSNADVWWYFKNTSGVFDPATTINNQTLNSGNAPQGQFILPAFSQQRSLISGIAGLTDVTTTVRPRTGTWFQGRVWYAGVDAQQPATGDAAFYTWTENIYFSQIVQTVVDFGNCFQQNDPTSEQLFDLLPTDGGVITIQGSGSIYKLFPIQNGMLVFAANGIWFITGSQGIGFSANDYTITKISNIQSISSTSFVNVTGLPYFWNEEGIYSVQPSQQGGLSVEPVTVGTILTFYNSIPIGSKKYVRGDYHPIDYVVQWIYKSAPEASVSDRYSFDKILNYNTYNKAFFPYTIASGTPTVNGINYVSSPGGSSTPDPVFKYLTSTLTIPTVTFSEERDSNYIDWFSFDNIGVNFISHFVTGYKLHGQGQRRFQIPYIYVFSRSDEPTSYKIQGLWDYAVSGASGRWSVAQLINNNSPNFGVVFRRHKIRGRGLVLQLKVTSSDGEPFDIMGWSTFETQNTGV